MQMITYKCPKCGYEESQRADLIVLAHKCKNATNYAKKHNGGLVEMQPKVRCNA